MHIYVDGTGFEFEVQGDEEWPVAGTITGFRFAIGSTQYWEMTGLNLPLTSLVNIFDTEVNTRAYYRSAFLRGASLQYTDTANLDDDVVTTTRMDTVLLAGGNDIVTDYDGADYLHGGSGVDTVAFSTRRGVVVDLNAGTATDGTGAVNTVIAFENARGGSGNDTITGNGFANDLSGNGGNDHLYGGGGNDTLNGGSGDDFLDGGAGDDTLNGSTGFDLLRGHAGNDVLNGGADNDHMEGGAGDDTLRGGTGNDLLNGEGDNDLLYGGDGNDYMNGASGNDRLYGGDGVDRMLGGSGDDRLNGGAGNDRLDGGAGNDIMTGGADVDTFVFAVASGTGADRITDFTDGVDRIQFVSGGAGFDFSDLTITSVSGGVRVTFTSLDAVVNTITLTGVTLSQIGASDFIFD